MRHWTVSLVRDGSVSRQWHVWAETLTIGSHGAAKVRLPLPVEPWALRLSELPEPQTFQLSEFTVQVADTTSERTRLWEHAQVRIENARVRSEREAQEIVANGPGTFQTAVTALLLAGATHWLADTLARPESRPLELRPAGVERSIVPAPSAVRPPFEILDRDAIARASGFVLEGAVSARIASASVSQRIASPAPVTRHASHGSWTASPPWAPESGLPRTALASAAWPESGPDAWESLDQPPPEPPH
jgi:hypothetical protein